MDGVCWVESANGLNVVSNRDHIFVIRGEREEEQHCHAILLIDIGGGTIKLQLLQLLYNHHFKICMSCRTVRWPSSFCEHLLGRSLSYYKTAH